MKYKVTKQHWGDQQYFEGDTREVKVESDAEQLMKMGLIEGSDAKEKVKADADAKAADEDAEERAIKADEAKTKAAEDNANEEKAAPKPKNKMAKEPANKAE